VYRSIFLNHGFLMVDRLTSMAVFVRAVELGGFAAAANEANISATKVAKHVRALEERLGAPGRR
jgi:DNA-binding transcriptional LysR family regulator